MVLTYSLLKTIVSFAFNNTNKKICLNQFLDKNEKDVDYVWNRWRYR